MAGEAERQGGTTEKGKWRKGNENTGGKVRPVRIGFILKTKREPIYHSTAGRDRSDPGMGMSACQRP